MYYGCVRKLEFECMDKCAKCDGVGYDPLDTANVVTCPSCQGSGVLQVAPFLMVPCGRCETQGTIVSNPCGVCTGQKFVYKKRSYDIKCPAGVPDGYENRMKGKGPYDVHAKSYADLVLVFGYNFSERIRIDNQRDIHIDLDVDLNELLYGFQRIISVYREHFSLKTTGYVDPGSALVLKEQGLPRINRNGASGDMFVHLRVSFPEMWNHNDDNEDKAGQASEFEWTNVTTPRSTD